MSCLKCGRDAQEDRVFCDSCQEEMRAYPVKPGTAVQLPIREDLSQEKKPRRSVLTPNEQIQHLQGLVRWLAVLVIVLAVALIVLCGLLLLR